jgi:integrase
MFRKPDHAQTQKRGFKTEREAELFLASVEVDKSRGAYIDRSKSRVLVGEWLDAWMDGRANWRATSRERARGIVALHFKPKLGGYPLGSLTHGAVQAWAGSLSKTQSPSSVHKIVNVLSGSLQMAVKDGRLPANPAHGLNLPKVGKPAKRYLTHDEVRDLADAVDSLGKGMYRGTRNNSGVLVKVLAYCGLRWGEASGLRVQDIDFARGWLDDAAYMIGQDGLTPHELRHTAASLAISAGANVKAVQRMLGHASAAVTLDVYSDLIDNDLDAVAAALDIEIARKSLSAQASAIFEDPQSG